MRQVVGHVAHADDQRLDAVEHRVEGARQLVEFVARGADGHATVERAVGDVVRGARHGLDAVQRAPGQEPADRAAEQQHDGQAEHKAAQDVALELFIVFERAPDLQPDARPERADERAQRGVARRQLARLEPRLLAGVGQPRRRQPRQLGPGAEVGRSELAAIAAPDSKVGLARLLALGVELHFFADAVDPFLAPVDRVLVEVFLQVFITALGDEADDQGIDHGKGEQRRGREDGRVPERQAQRQRARQLREEHSPCRARCGSAASRSPCRSCRAGGRCATRQRWSAGRSCSPTHAR